MIEMGKYFDWTDKPKQNKKTFWGKQLGCVAKIGVLTEHLGLITEIHPLYITLQTKSGDIIKIFYNQIHTSQFGHKVEKEYNEEDNIDWNVDI